MDNIKDLINAIRDFQKSKTKTNCNKIGELFFDFSENITKFKTDDFTIILHEIKKIDKETILYNSPLNLLYAISNHKLKREIEFEYIYAWYLLVDIGDIFSKQHLVYQSLITNFNIKVANDLLRKFYEKDENSTSSLKLSMLGLIEKNATKSANYFTKAIIEDTNNWFANLNLGMYYLYNENYENGVKKFENILKYKDALIEIDYYPDILLKLGDVYSFKLKDLIKGEEYYKECLKITPNLNGLNNNYGYCLFRLKKYKTAEKYLKKATRLENDKETPLWNLLRVYKRIKDYEKALVILRKLKKTSKRKITINREISTLENKVVTIENIDISHEIKDAVIDYKDKKSKNYHISKFKKSKSIGQESMLEELIHNRIKRGEVVFQRKLKIYQDELYYGKQLIMPDVGRLDLLVIDTKTKELIVVELKKDDSYNDVISQTLKYIKWIKENIGKKYEVKGLICLHKASVDLLENAKEQNIEIQEYNFDFTKRT